MDRSPFAGDSIANGVFGCAHFRLSSPPGNADNLSNSLQEHLVLIVVPMFRPFLFIWRRTRELPYRSSRAIGNRQKNDNESTNLILMICLLQKLPASQFSTQGPCALSSKVWGSGLHLLTCMGMLLYCIGADPRVCGAVFVVQAVPNYAQPW